MESSGASSGPTRVHCPKAPLIVGVGLDVPNCLGFDGLAPESVVAFGGTNAAGYEKAVVLAPAKFSVTRELPPRVTFSAAVLVIAKRVVDWWPVHAQTSALKVAIPVAAVNGMAIAL